MTGMRSWTAEVTATAPIARSRPSFRFHPSMARSCRLWHGSPQAGLRLTDDLLVVVGNDPLHIDACPFDPRFVRQSLELNLNVFGLLRRQQGDGESGGFACGGLNFHRVRM